jgi:hypothetical protein
MGDALRSDGADGISSTGEREGVVDVEMREEVDIRVEGCSCTYLWDCGGFGFFFSHEFIQNSGTSAESRHWSRLPSCHHHFDATLNINSFIFGLLLINFTNFTYSITMPESTDDATREESPPKP